MKKPKIFENKVGRPSNDLKKKRKKYIALLIVGCVAIAMSVTYVTINVINNRLLASSGSSNSNSDKCNMPYTYSKCSSVENSTVRKVKQYLARTEDYVYTDSYDKKFDKDLDTGVRNFQRKNKDSSGKALSVDGSIGPLTLEAISREAQTISTKKIKKKVCLGKLCTTIKSKIKPATTKYYKITYNLNGGSGTLDASYNNLQVILAGVSTKIPSTRLTKANACHSGWTSSYDGKVYSPGQSVTWSNAIRSSISYKNKVVGYNVQMTAKWETGAYYDSATGKCVKGTRSSAFPISTVEYSSNWITCTNSARNQSCGNHVSRGFCLQSEVGNACKIPESSYYDHYGIDFRTRVNGVATNVPVYNVYPGRVLYSGWMNGYGNTVIVGHEYDSKTGGYYFYSLYAHLNSLGVKKDDKVSAGAQIAISGNSGTKALHLHFELRIPKTPGTNGGQRSDGKNPEKFFNGIVNGNLNNVINQIKTGKY